MLRSLVVKAQLALYVNSLSSLTQQLGNSAALVADAMHSANDMVTDLVTLWSYSMARKPRDPVCI